ncbi:hypothetical protein [Phytohabitans kaempferiae]|uniref:Uncharacterized protein n=1 Tax=Phytohabitans kaempferiae TaxID=1620943 RepID=A0ABV6MGQ6_9ACTN
MPVPTSVGDRPMECIFFFSPLGQPPAQTVSIRLVKGSGLPGFPPLDGLGYEAQWHGPGRSLRVQLPGAP